MLLFRNEMSFKSAIKAVDAPIAQGLIDDRTSIGCVREGSVCAVQWVAGGRFRLFCGPRPSSSLSSRTEWRIRGFLEAD
jgi:hypothetical protein